MPSPARPVPELPDDATVAEATTACAGIAPPSPSSATTRAASPGWSAWTTGRRVICDPGLPDRPPSAHRASTVR
ncbi:hypothetical protein ACSCB1_33415 [Streptomyces europaeiscabiei]|uniref:hypothetical protein n=1 Tax=Streptomyces europaeiscabiei TaxID=146819 RepID=UPI0018FE5EDC|nr:hypothetical protein [Streptomyces europaeiscabiei]